MLEKKFKIRIKKFGSIGHYCIQYTYYRFIPIWCTIVTWLNYSNTINPILEKYPYIKTIACQFKTIEDVKKHIALSYQKEKEYNLSKKIYKKEIVKIPDIEYINYNEE